MNWFIVLGLGLVVLGVAGFWLVSRGVNLDNPLNPGRVFLGLACIYITVMGLMQTYLAIQATGPNPTGVAGVVTAVTVTNPGNTTLTVQSGEQSVYNIACLPAQKACQAARQGDLVQYDVTIDPSGWGKGYREIRFITRGANS
ncbi:MAG: hypothetical protein ACM3KF_04665 [Acidobacteriota bacterium]